MFVEIGENNTDDNYQDETRGTQLLQDRPNRSPDRWNETELGYATTKGVESLINGERNAPVETAHPAGMLDDYPTEPSHKQKEVGHAIGREENAVVTTIDNNEEQEATQVRPRLSRPPCPL